MAEMMEKLGDDVIVGSRGMTDLSADAPLGHGKVVKVYPEIENGDVLADVEVADLGDFFVGERTPRPILVFVLPVAVLLICGFFLWDWTPSWLDPRIDRALMLVDPAGFRWVSAEDD